MKLIDLFTIIPEDFAIRPLEHADRGDLPTFDPVYSKVVGSQDGVDVWGSREKQGFDIYGFRDSNETIAFIALSSEEVKPNFQKFHQLWVSSLYRKRGLGAGLIMFLIRKLGINLVLDKDEIVSLDARNLIGKLHADGRLKLSRDGLLLTKDEAFSILNDLSINDVSITIHERKADVPLFGGSAKLANGMSRLQEASVVQVFQFNAVYD